MNTLLPREELLHYLWRVGDFDVRDLRTTERIPLTLVQRGIHNHNAGPDFLNGKISLGGVTWSGHIEIHVLASDWDRHGHSDDPAYHNVILHVVYQMDTEIRRPDGTIIPTLELMGRVDHNKLRLSDLLISQANDIPCKHFLDRVNRLHWQNWLDRMFVERLEGKAMDLFEELKRKKFDWDQVLYQAVGKSVGALVNGEAFWELTCRTPLNLLRRCRGRAKAMEALLFGQAGLLHNHDKYSKTLSQEYRHYRRLHGLQPMEPVHWKFGRMRPSNLPTMRIAQFAGWLDVNDHSFSDILKTSSAKPLYAYLAMEAGVYWRTHYRFGVKTRTKGVRVGKARMNTIIINAILPMIYLYGLVSGDSGYTEKTLKIAQEIAPEKNKITRLWKDTPLSFESAVDSQGALHLTREYCRKRKCLSCAIGHRILKIDN